MMKRTALLFLAASTLLFATALGAAGPTDKGIQINYGATPLNNPYNSMPAHAVLAANYSPSTVTGNDFASPLRLQTQWNQGGQYSGTAQTAFPVSAAFTTMRGQGQGIGYWHFINGYGKGNAYFGNGVSNCYGGGEVALPSSTPSCAAAGEFDAVQGSLVWYASLTTPITTGSTTLHYTSATNNTVLGARAILNINHVHVTGTISSYTSCTDSSAGACSVTAGTCPLGAGSTCTVITFAGSTLPTASPTAWYFKSKYENDNYSDGSGCGGDDVSIGHRCVGHWYKVGNIPDTTHLVLSGVFDAINLTPNVGGGDYLMVQGIEATAVDPVAQTITIPSNSLNWASTEAVYSPPSHYIGMIGQLVVLTKHYKTGFESASSAGYQINSNGEQPIDYGLVMSGAGGIRHGVEIQNLKGADARGINIDGSYRYGFVASANDDGSTHTAIAVGTSGQCQMGCGLSGTAWTLAGKMVSTSVGVDPDGGGKKIGTVTDASGLTALSRRDETITWTSAFRGTTYSPICTAEESTGFVTVVGVKTIGAGSVVVTVQNTDSVSTHNPFTVHCFAEWRGN